MFETISGSLMFTAATYWFWITFVSQRRKRLNRFDRLDAAFFRSRHQRKIAREI
jgi:hypothetical protein